MEVTVAIDLPVDHPQFFAHTFSLLAKRRAAAFAKGGDNLKKICTEEYEALSNLLDDSRIQESSAVRNVLRTRRLANLLIDDKGELIASLLPTVIGYLKENLYVCGPERQYDTRRNEHMVKVLQLLQSNKDLVRLLKNISKPFSNSVADEIIRDTLQIPSSVTLTDAHVRRAALSAWMCYLRQNVGSCFATAPAIIVHDEQPELFLKDLSSLLSMGRLKRTFGGIEYSVPLSNSWGAGDLKKPFYLRKPNTTKLTRVWHSPGIIAGLDAAGIFPEGTPLKDKVLLAKRAILKAHPFNKEEINPIITTSEDILKAILMQHNNITEKELKEYENRPIAIFQGSLMMHAPRSLAKGTAAKGEGCANFIKQFEWAKKGFKALADNALLKAWEFSLASFAETKADFARWNFYSSLGLNAKEPGGIGECLFEILKRKLDECNAKVQELQADYEQAYAQVKYVEGRLSRASTEKEVQWLKSEYSARSHEFYTLEEMRNTANNKAKRFAQLFDVLIGLYDDKFPEYFQEVYDADMHEVEAGPYDDSPAGFRLLYKHGRSNTAQWTKIYDYKGFIDALASFFIMTESELKQDPSLQGLEDDFTEIVTAIVSHIKTPRFIESAFYRMAVAHNGAVVENPLENLEKVEKKPWAYTSGGNMGTLVSCYYKLEQPPTEVGRWVDNEMELLVFLIDSLKQIPAKNIEPFINEPYKSLLIHSPTHAFLLKPGFPRFKDCLLTESFTYTCVRDSLVQPMQRFIDNITIDDQMATILLDHIKGLFPPQGHYIFYKAFTIMPHNMTPPEFRRHVIEVVTHDKALRTFCSAAYLKDEIDTLMYAYLPMFSSYQLRDRIQNMCSTLPSIPPSIQKRMMEIFDSLSGRYTASSMITAKSLQDIVKALIALAYDATTLPFDCHKEVASAAQQLGYAMPTPIAFADTNWVKDEFGFLVNPGNGKLELWRMDYLGNAAAPMSAWKMWLDGSRKDRTWGVYTRPHEYASS